MSNGYDSKPGGALFANNNRQKDTHPNYRGTLRLDADAIASLVEQQQRGVPAPMLELSAWKKESSKGVFLSLNAKRPYEKKPSQGGGYGSGRTASNGPSFDLNDEIPF